MYHNEFSHEAHLYHSISAILSYMKLEFCTKLKRMRAFHTGMTRKDKIQKALVEYYRTNTNLGFNDMFILKSGCWVSKKRNWK